jgi:hypothetical protein
MKGLLYIILFLAVVVGCYSAYLWGMKDMPIEEQITYVREKYIDKTPISHTADSASKLGKVLKGNFEEAEDVYKNGPEAKYE